MAGGLIAAAADALPDAPERLHEKTALLAMAWDGLGFTDRSDDALARLENSPGEWAALRVAEIHARRGSQEEAFAWLREALDRAAGDPFQRRHFCERIEDSPVLDGLKEDPQWHRFLTRAEAFALSANPVGAC
jgi:hypothetical protein